MNYKNVLLNLTKFKHYNYNLFGDYVGTSLDTEKRVYWHKVVINCKKMKCGCLYIEEHLVCCENYDQRKFRNYDPNVKDTYLHQAIDKFIVLGQLKKKVNRVI